MPPPPPGPLPAPETLNLCLPPPPDQVRLVTPRFAAFKGAQKDRFHNLVQRFRLAPEEVEPAIAELRAFFRGHDRHEINYEVGPSCTPPDLVDRLAALGMVPDDEPEIAGMV